MEQQFKLNIIFVWTQSVLKIQDSIYLNFFVYLHTGKKAHSSVMDQYIPKIFLSKNGTTRLVT